MHSIILCCKEGINLCEWYCLNGDKYWWWWGWGYGWGVFCCLPGIFDWACFFLKKCTGISGIMLKAWCARLCFFILPVRARACVWRYNWQIYLLRWKSSEIMLFHSLDNHKKYRAQMKRNIKLIIYKLILLTLRRLIHRDV